MGKFADAFWYYMGIGWMFVIPLNRLIDPESSLYTLLYFVGLGMIFFTMWLCLRYRPAKPKRVALFDFITLLGFVLVGKVTGTDVVKLPLLTLTKWVTALLFAHLFSIQRIDRKIPRLAN